jgi:hypothetical protein
LVAQAEWVASAMTVIQVGGRSIAICDDDGRAQYVSFGRISEMGSAATDLEVAQPVRMLVDLQRNFGGLTPRALLGGQFSGQRRNDTIYEVIVGDSFDALSMEQDLKVATRPTESGYHARPFSPGLPREFAPAALRGLMDDEWCDVELPPGQLLVDRAGFDEQGSSAVIFDLAGKMLRSLFAVRLSGGDINAEARRLIEFW